MSDKRPGEMTAEELDGQISKAAQMVRDLAHGNRDWMMSIPARPDYDPDLVIADGLLAGKEALRRLNAGASTGQTCCDFTGEHWLGCPNAGKTPAATTPGQPASSEQLLPCERAGFQTKEEMEYVYGPGYIPPCQEEEEMQAAPGQPSGAREPRCPKCGSVHLSDSIQAGENYFTRCQCSGGFAEFDVSNLNPSDFAQFFSQPTPDVERVSGKIIEKIHNDLNDVGWNGELLKTSDKDIAAILAPYLSGEGRREK